MRHITNRAVITVIPKAAFIAWVQALGSKAAEISLEDISASHTAYLAHDSEDGDDEERIIRKNYKVVFEEELNGWTIDESLWPKKRDLKTFNTWFQATVHSLVLDLDDRPYILEED